MAMQLRGAESVVMAGDPKQLPPTVISDVAMKCNMDTTLFERLMVSASSSLNDSQDSKDCQKYGTRQTTDAVLLPP